MTYADKLKDPRWQKKRLEILSESGFLCEDCGAEDKTLHVHHTYYEKGLDPWDYPNYSLHSLCADCHAKDQEHLLAIQRQIGRMMLEDHEMIFGVLCGLEMHDFPQVRSRVRSYEMAYGIGLACWGLSPEEVIATVVDGWLDGYALFACFEAKSNGQARGKSPTPPNTE